MPHSVITVLRYNACKQSSPTCWGVSLIEIFTQPPTRPHTNTSQVDTNTPHSSTTNTKEGVPAHGPQLQMECFWVHGHNGWLLRTTAARFKLGWGHLQHGSTPGTIASAGSHCKASHTPLLLWHLCHVCGMAAGYQLLYQPKAHLHPHLPPTPIPFQSSIEAIKNPLHLDFLRNKGCIVACA